MCAGDDALHQVIARIALDTYAALPDRGKPRRRSNRAPEWTVLAAVCLYRASEHAHDVQCISLGTGLRALPHARLPIHGDVLHDSHAEVIARRGFKYWLYTQIERAAARDDPAASSCSSELNSSVYVERVNGNQWRLLSDWKVAYYVSTLPCGDASTYYLSCTSNAGAEACDVVEPTSASSGLPTRTAHPHPALAVAASLGLHTSHDPPSTPPATRPEDTLGAANQSGRAPTGGEGIVHRGRASYSTLSILRTKPGRADSAPTTSHSCSDKLALWNLVGLQGALLSQLGVHRVPIDVLVVGGFGAPSSSEFDSAHRARICAECARAVGGRLEAWVLHEYGTPRLEDQEEFRVPEIGFADQAFPHARDVVAQREGVPAADVVGCAESLSYVDEPSLPRPARVEILTNGIRQGASAKRAPGQPLGPKTRSRLCKLSLYQRHCALRDQLEAQQRAKEDGARAVAVEAAPSAGVDSPVEPLPPNGHPNTYYDTKHALPNSPPLSSLPSTPSSSSSSPSSARFLLPALGASASAVHPAERYLSRKAAVRATGPFRGWLVSGRAWESFDPEGRVVVDVDVCPSSASIVDE